MTGSPPRLEWTPDGWQYLLPGCEGPDLKQRLEAAQALPMVPAKPQQSCGFGLFDLAARDQLSLFD